MAAIENPFLLDTGAWVAVRRRRAYERVALWGAGRLFDALVLNGGFAPGTAGNPRPYGMPPFRPLFDDEEVAAVVSYVRNSWGNKAGYVSPVEVDRFRSAPLD